VIHLALTNANFFIFIFRITLFTPSSSLGLSGSGLCSSRSMHACADWATRIVDQLIHLQLYSSSSTNTITCIRQSILIALPPSQLHPRRVSVIQNHVKRTKNQRPGDKV